MSALRYDRPSMRRWGSAIETVRNITTEQRMRLRRLARETETDLPVLGTLDTVEAAELIIYLERVRDGRG